MKIRIHIPLLLLLVISVLTFSCDQQEEKKETTEEPNTNNEPVVNQQQNKTPDKTVLIGDWTRTDAPYQIKITELLDDGTTKAGYFNPKSINVGSALWAFADGMLKIYIELRDENYPGSNYNLTYLPDRDMLAGKYFQAVEKVSYDVGFLRTK